MANNYKARMVSEYLDLYDKIEKLEAFIEECRKKPNDIELSCPLWLLEEQKTAMCRYLEILQLRLETEHIWIPVIDSITH